MSDSITVSETATLVSAPTPLFNCHFFGLLTVPETLRNHQLCLAEWLRAYANEEVNDTDWFKKRPLLLFGYSEVDELLTELIEISFDTDAEARLTARLNKFAEESTSEDLDHKRELIRDSFLSFLPRQDDASTNISMYEHGYAYTNLYEFINKCIYHVQDQDAEPAYLKGITPNQKQVILGMKARGEDPKEYTDLANNMRIGNGLREQLNAMP